MRKIAYRAWDKKAKEIICVSSINLNKDGTLFICGGNHIHSKCKKCKGDTNDFRTLFKDYILMQWTGLKDKSGVEIYDGDIVLLEDEYTEPITDDGRGPQNPANHLTEVKIERGCFGLDIKETGDIYNKGFYCFHYDELIVEELEVIGNIYSNPELLK